MYTPRPTTYPEEITASTVKEVSNSMPACWDSNWASVGNILS